MSRFVDRADAGRQLAGALDSWRADPRALVLGLARGGVVVAAQVALALDAKFTVMVVRKLGLPGHPEVAMGAIGEGGVMVMDERTVSSAGVTPERFAEVRSREEVELARRVKLYRAGAPDVSIADAVALIVDDGIATGATARAACRVARAARAARVVLAAPVGARSAVGEVRGEADEVVVLVTAGGSFAVGEWYDDFDQTSDAEVLAWRDEVRRRHASSERGSGE
ncbi:MAG TPA: phosphoribosyltransferase family protein [Acidimicrobiales bacterium]|nr:phosphoribosyltransferase family protein [Acidimicrobiales bacterium]